MGLHPATSINITAAVLVATVILLCNVGTANANIDFETFPECGRSACFPFHFSALGCAVSAPDSTECFCTSRAPVNCSAEACTGSEWYEVEDWFAQQCETVPVATLAGIPSCARRCVRDALIPSHCKAKLTENCFCRVETAVKSLRGCLKDGCGVDEEEAAGFLDNYYRDTCVYAASANGVGSLGEGSDQSDHNVPEQTGRHKDTRPPLTSVEMTGIVLGAISIIPILVGLFRWINRHYAGGNPDVSLSFFPCPRHFRYLALEHGWSTNMFRTMGLSRNFLTRLLRTPVRDHYLARQPRWDDVIEAIETICWRSFVVTYSYSIIETIV